jgi:hypothetical protein
VDTKNRKKQASTVYAMKVAGTQHIIERTYREGGVFQWVRETYINAIEAGATRVEYGVEWQAVENKGAYRRLIADNGKGMMPEELVEFFNTFGGGGKPIGGAAENFGVGAKTALLPWNQYGVVVVSWVAGEGSMIWLQRDPDTGDYGLRYFEAVDQDTGDVTREMVVRPFVDDVHGCDWSAVKPSWIEEHGTVLVLLGSRPNEDTVLGDPNRSEGGVHGIAKYLNQRIWDIPTEYQVSVEVFQSDSKNRWPRNEQEARTTGPRANLRRSVPGARHWIEYPEGHEGGQLSNKGTIDLADGTGADWFLWAGERPQVHGYASEYGYIAALYRNELYNFRTHNSLYRSLGVSLALVRQRLWVIFRPVELDEGKRHGVFPTTDRNSLKLRGGPNAGDDLPIDEWANEFAEKMPEAIRKALADARSGDARGIEDDAWRERLMERFGPRWKMTKFVAQQTGLATVKPVQPGRKPSAPTGSARGSQGGTAAGGGPKGSSLMGSTAGPVPARAARVGGALPYYRTAKAEDFDHPGLLAAWQPHDPQYPTGVVLLNVEHPVLIQQIQHYQSLYPDHLSEEIEGRVIGVYGEVAVAKVAHSESMRSLLPANVIDKELRSPYALTMALLGLVTEDAIINSRLGGKFGKARDAA